MVAAATAPGNMRLTYNRFNELADRDGFIIVYPEAVDKNWNDGRSSDRVRAWREDIDDVGFIVAVLDRVANAHSIDRERVFSVGMSQWRFHDLAPALRPRRCFPRRGHPDGHLVT